MTYRIYGGMQKFIKNPDFQSNGTETNGKPEFIENTEWDGIHRTLITTEYLDIAKSVRDRLSEDYENVVICPWP